MLPMCLYLYYGNTQIVNLENAEPMNERLQIPNNHEGQHALNLKDTYNVYVTTLFRNLYTGLFRPSTISISDSSSFTLFLLNQSQPTVMLKDGNR